jgi:hypothetical protein
MKTALLLSALLLLTPATRAGDSTLEEGFAALFNGKDLAGWIKASGPEISAKYQGGKWTVEDGAICGAQLDDGLGSFLHTEKPYSDFELLIDVNPSWGCDSGVFLRTNPKGQCIQVFLDYLPDGNVGFLYGQGSGGFCSMPWQLKAVEKDGKVTGVQAVDVYDGVEIDGLVYSSKAADFNKVWRHGEFNTLKIRCTGKYPVITTWVNGVKMMEMDSTTFKARSLAGMRAKAWITPSAYDKEKILESTGGKGTLALQVHPGSQRWHGTDRYKNIRLREL